MENPFELIGRRLGVIEDFLLDIRKDLRSAPAHASSPLPRFCGFRTVKDAIFPDVAESTLRQMIARDKDKSMGFFKLGKTLQCDTTILLAWIADQRNKSLESVADEVDVSFMERHKGSRKRRTNA